MTRETKALENLLLLLKETNNRNGWTYVQSFISESHHYVNKIIRNNSEDYLFLLKIYKMHLLERINLCVVLSDLEKNYLRNHVVGLYRMNLENKNKKAVVVDTIKVKLNESDLIFLRHVLRKHPGNFELEQKIDDAFKKLNDNKADDGENNKK